MGNRINFAPASIITGSGAPPQSRVARNRKFLVVCPSIWPLFVPNSPFCGRFLLTLNRVDAIYSSGKIPA